MITAKEARNISGKTSEEFALDFEDAIKSAASKGDRSLTKYHGELENEAYRTTAKWKSFVDYMTTLGYTVGFLYEEKHFFNMAIIIRW